MNKIYFLFKCFAIVVIGTCTLMLVVMMTSCTTANNADHVTLPYKAVADSVNITDSVRFAICEQVINELAQCNILSKENVQQWYWAKHCKSTINAALIIEECSENDGFTDTVASGDAWQDYQKYVAPYVFICDND